METPEGPRQTYFPDFFNYAGLHRSVWLYTTPRSHIDTAGEEPGEIRVALREAEGVEGRASNGGSGELTVEDVHPWRPGEGCLYELAVELWGDADVPVDAYELPAGIRTVRVDGTQFLINDEPFYFTGFGKARRQQSQQSIERRPRERDDRGLAGIPLARTPCVPARARTCPDRAPRRDAREVRATPTDPGCHRPRRRGRNE